MRNTIVAIILSLFGFQLLAQNLPPVGAKWYYQVHCMNWPLFFIPCDYISVEVVKDTVVDNKNGIFIQRSYNGSVTPEASLIFVEDSGRIYFYEDQQLKQLFDFNLQIGDTLAFQIPKLFQFYNIDCSDGWDSVTYYSVIDNISIENIDNVALKHFHTKPVYKDQNEFWRLGTFSERLLAKYAFLGGGSVICLGGFPGYLRCYEDNDIFYKISQEDCDATDPTYTTDLLKPILKLTANPVHNELIIISNTGEPVNSSIYSVEGKFIGKYFLSEKENKIDISQLPSGIYFINFNGSYSQKFLKL